MLCQYKSDSANRSYLFCRHVLPFNCQFCSALLCRFNIPVWRVHKQKIAQLNKHAVLLGKNVKEWNFTYVCHRILRTNGFYTSTVSRFAVVILPFNIYGHLLTSVPIIFYTWQDYAAIYSSLLLRHIRQHTSTRTANS